MDGALQGGRRRSSWPVAGLLALGMLGALALLALRPAPVVLADALVHGRVLWKNTETVVPQVALSVSDQRTGQAVMAATTDATGWYTLTVGVGDWLINIPSTDHYWGYAQEVVVMPHDDQVMDFAITPRAPGEAPSPGGQASGTATPAPAAVTPTAVPLGRGGSGGLPATGEERDLAEAPWLVGLGSLVLMLGLLLRRWAAGRAWLPEGAEVKD